MQSGKLGRDLTEGSIPRHLLAVAMPMLIGNFIQTGYSIIDAIWIGRIVGRSAMGAIAISFPILFIFIAVAAGATMATTILISQYYGAKNFELLKKTVGSSVLFAIMLGVVLSTAGFFSTEQILHLLKTPESLIGLASSYLKINFIGFTIMYMGFLVTSILRGIGDTKTPLLFMVVGVAINALLDPLLIIGVGPFPKLGLNGAAVASIAGQLVAFTMGFFYLRNRGNLVAIRLKTLVWDSTIIKLIMRIGFPSMIQQSALSLGMAAIISFVNRFGETATAAFGATSRLDAVAFLPAMSIGMAISAISGQNLGAKKYERVQQTFRWGLLLTVCFSTFFSIVFLTIPGKLLSLFINDPEVISIGTTYLRIVGPSSIMFAIMFVANGVINGAGHTKVTLAFTLISLWGIRVPIAAVLSKTALGLTGIWLSFTVSFAIIMTISLLWYRSGRWKKIVISTVSDART